jgi:hypothetical protein
MDTASQFSITEQKLVQATQHAHSKTWIEALGTNVSRYGLVLTLLLIGALKFTAGEAQAFSPWWRTAHSCSDYIESSAFRVPQI